MSKQSEAKKAQNYRENADTCANCANYQSELIEKKYDGYNGILVWTEEKGKRCTVGEFAVKKTATCDQHLNHVLTDQAEKNRNDAERYRKLVATGKFCALSTGGWGLGVGYGPRDSKDQLDAAADSLPAPK